MDALLALAALGVIGAAVQLVRMQKEQDHLKQSLRRYDSLISKESLEQKLDAAILCKKDELATLDNQHRQIAKKVGSLQAKIRSFEEEQDLQELGFYEPQYDFITSEDYRQRFAQVTEERKRMWKNKAAAICYKRWSVENDIQKGRKITETYIRLILGTFDTVCDSALSEAKSTNISKLRSRIINTFERLNKSSKILECEIQRTYLDLRLRELDIKYEMEIKKQEERERDKILREQLLKEKKEREFLEKAEREIEEAEQSELEHKKEIDRIRQQIERIEDGKRIQLELKIKELEQQVEQDRQNKENAILRSGRIKSGFIYVVSSIGSFESGIYRICMTRSSEPDKYIREMNPVVPFPFHIHFKIFSEDVSATLKQLHDSFHDKRVNKYNLRRDFFRISLEDIEKTVSKIDRETGQLKNIQRFDITPMENEYLLTRSIERKAGQAQPTNLMEDDNVA